MVIVKCIAASWVINRVINTVCSLLVKHVDDIQTWAAHGISIWSRTECKILILPECADSAFLVLISSVRKLSLDPNVLRLMYRWIFKIENIRIFFFTSQTIGIRGRLASIHITYYFISGFCCGFCAFRVIAFVFCRI